MKKILIANRGEIAVRIIRTCQELGIKTVAIHSLADKDALHCKLADESVCIGPNSSLKSYLSTPSIMSAVEITGADAIHPGYGYLSENDAFATICNEYGLTFIGPTPEQINVLGNKLSAKKLAKDAGLQLIPGSTSRISDQHDALDIAKKIGFPVLLKAANGGGGKGIKIVNHAHEFSDNLHLAQTEAQQYFDSPDVYLEKYLSNPRHIEVQIIGDQFGNIIHLGERECSIQRKNQKILEEAPANFLTTALRQTVCQAAVTLAKKINYQSLGTVEFLYQDGQFYFIEMNTRIQVEHPVTEMITGTDLVKEQVLIALGKKLSFKQDDIKLNGHAIECRINAEDPDNFMPCPGHISEYYAPGGPGVRVDSLAYRGYSVPPYYDSLVAKVITHHTSRANCIRKMQRALNELKITGIKTNTALHQKILDNPQYNNNDFSTKFLHNLFTNN